ncbi:MAG TPA: hypothetical protein HPQ03_01650 [Deltaproteobacteria bacterium]|nr:hypothetical protein [Deltaproteobacteria bacterium]
MQTAKQEVRELLETLPDDSTFEDIQYHLYVRQKVEQGIQDINDGKTYFQDEVEKRMERWVKK